MSQIYKNNSGSGMSDVTSVIGTNGVTVSPTVGDVVVSGINATTSTVGVASFNPEDFTISGSGAVSSLPTAGILVASGQLTSAQIKTLNASPVTIIAAPGSGNVTQILSIVGTLNYGGSNPFTNPHTIFIYYSTVTQIANLLQAAAISDSASQIQINPTVEFNPTYAAVVNMPVNIYNISTEITGNAAGDNTISYSIIYRIIKIP